MIFCFIKVYNVVDYFPFIMKMSFFVSNTLQIYAFYIYPPRNLTLNKGFYKKLKRLKAALPCRFNALRIGGFAFSRTEQLLIGGR